MIRSRVMFVLGWPRWFKRLVALALDLVLCVLTTWLAFYLRLGVWVNVWGEQLTPDLLARPGIATIAAIVIALPIFIFFGLYRAIFRYSGWPALLLIAKAIGLYGIIYIAIFTVFGVQGVPRTIGLIQPMLLLFAIGGSRALVSYWFGNSYREQLLLGRLPKVLVYGAGVAGRELVAAIRNSKKMQVVGFVDDDPAFQGGILNGVKIYSPEKLPALVQVLEISDILLAIPSISRSQRAEIIAKLSKLKVSIRTLPSVQDIASGKITISDIHDLDIQDLLGRDLVIPDAGLLAKNIYKKVILVTGAGGSIGGELCRQILQQDPVQIILLEQSEFALYAVEQELNNLITKNTHLKISIVPVLGSVQSESLICGVFAKYSPHIIFHAAAYKHVPLVEANIVEGVLNNVYGTYNLAKLAIQLKVPNFVLISTDKAVRPTNVMGASKRLAEMVLQAFADDQNASSLTTFSMVRFGNVLNSSGSVVPLFRKQIQEGGPVTLTHPEVTRFFMMIPEAAQLVIQASAMASGGDVFVLDMGQPVKIIDLAKKMIKLSGLKLRDKPGESGDIEIQITGLRLGEKLYEELLIGENPQPTGHPQIMKAHEAFIPLSQLESLLIDFQSILASGCEIKIKEFIKTVVTEYQPESVDKRHYQV
jgi:FlaA1/EpsC-like NDP-sugar epimerase